MSEAKVMELSPFLPIYKVDGSQVTYMFNGEEKVIGTLNTSIEQEVEEAEKAQLEDSINNDNDEGDLSWLDENLTTGEIGEILALEYLKTLYSDVSDVSSDAKRGYDLEVKENERIKGVEVKTSRSRLGFHITFNELRVATAKQDDYYLFFIHENVMDERYEGFIVKNPIKVFGIDFEALTEHVKCQNISIIPNHFFIKFDKGYLRSLKKIELEQYI